MYAKFYNSNICQVWQHQMLSFQGRDTCQIHFLPTINKIYSIFVLIFQLRKLRKKAFRTFKKFVLFFNSSKLRNIGGKIVIFGIRLRSLYRWVLSRTSCPKLPLKSIYNDKNILNFCVK